MWYPCYPFRLNLMITLFEFEIVRMPEMEQSFTIASDDFEISIRFDHQGIVFAAPGDPAIAYFEMLGAD